MLGYYDIEHEPEIVDLDSDIESINIEPICDFCGMADLPKAFNTYSDLVQHRVDVHQDKSNNEYIEKPAIEFYICKFLTFAKDDDASIDSWIADNERFMSTEVFNEMKPEIHVVQKNLRPVV